MSASLWRHGETRDTGTVSENVQYHLSKQHSTCQIFWRARDAGKTTSASSSRATLSDQQRTSWMSCRHIGQDFGALGCWYNCAQDLHSVSQTGHKVESHSVLFAMHNIDANCTTNIRVRALQCALAGAFVDAGAVQEAAGGLILLANDTEAILGDPAAPCRLPRHSASAFVTLSCHLAQSDLLPH